MPIIIDKQNSIAETPKEKEILSEYLSLEPEKYNYIGIFAWEDDDKCYILESLDCESENFLWCFNVWMSREIVLRKRSLRYYFIAPLGGAIPTNTDRHKYYMSRIRKNIINRKFPHRECVFIKFHKKEGIIPCISNIKIDYNILKRSEAI
jgi:hypothetical protein